MYEAQYMTLNIGSPDVRPISALADQVRLIYGLPFDVVRVTKIPGRMTLVKSPCLKRQDLLGWDLKVGFRDGIRRVCDAVQKGK